VLTSSWLILRRTAAMLVMLFVMLTLNFLIFHAAPGSPADRFAAVPGGTPQQRAALTAEFGLNHSEWYQYVRYVDETVHGNLGVSFENDQPVMHNLSVDLQNTVPMVGLGILVAAGLGIATGVFSGARWGSGTDKVLTGGSLALYSLPTQWVGLLLILLVAKPLGLPTSGMENPYALSPSFWSHIGDILEHMTLPSLTLAISTYGYFVLIARSATLDTLSADYLLTAKAKGVTPSRVLLRHSLPNAMLPIVTIIGLSMGFIVAGAVLVEAVFSWPGIGEAIYQAVLNDDYPMLQGAFLLLLVSVVFFNFLADLLYARLDPRVRR
jgi:ABC-type dipeptide/oligopeptide/nickel transport system permease component